MSSTAQKLSPAGKGIRKWGKVKKSLLALSAAGFIASSFLFLTPPGLLIREKLAETVITTQHRNWAWIFVGAERRDSMVRHMQEQMEIMGSGHIDTSMIQVKKRTVGELIKVEDVSGQYYKGKKIYVYDPKSIRVVVPSKVGEGEKISDMVKRTGAVAGVNGGGFDDPDGLGNGFAPIGFIMSGKNLLFTGLDGSVPQHVVGFTEEGKLIVGKYSIDELTSLHVTEAVSFYPRVIADGKPLITSGDGGWGRGPRTAVGQKADGTVIFIVIDGRQPQSVGATLREVQDLFMADGVINAGFLDGGASSELVVGGELLTKPSSKYGERRLPSAFLIFDNPSSYKATKIWDGLTTIDPGGAATHKEYQEDLAKQRANGTLKSSPSPSSKVSSGGSTPKTSSSPKSSSTPKETSEPKNTPSGGASSTPKTSVKPNPTSTPVSTPKPDLTPKPDPTATPKPDPTTKPPVSNAPTAPSSTHTGGGTEIGGTGRK